MRMLAGIVLMSVMMSGCDNPTTPLAPTPPPQAAPPPGSREIQLTGVVFDTAFRRLAGAVVEILDGSLAGSSATTGPDGVVSFHGALDGSVRARASKDGHVTATETSGDFCSTCSPPRRSVVFYLVPTAPPVTNLAGSYTLTVAADPACRDLPDDMRTRSYGATVAPASSFRGPAGTQFEVRLGGAPFVASFDRFSIGVAGDVVGLEFWGDVYGFAEQVSARTTLAFGGRAEVSVGPSVSTISTTFEGVIDYCVLKADTNQFWQCDPAHAVAHVACESTNHRLILTRR